MLKNRQGFTLIELLIVVVIIGILAAIAIPKFGKSREKAYISAMQSDLRQLMTAQEMYYSDPENEYTYASGTIGGANDETIDGLNVTASEGVEIVVEASNQAPAGWNAKATHAATTWACGVYFGDQPGAPDIAGATLVEGVITCADEGAGGGGSGDPQQ